MRTTLRVVSLLLLLIAGFFGWQYYRTNHDFTPWMDKATLDAYIKTLDNDKPGEKSYWERGNRITAIEGRWRNGKA